MNHSLIAPAITAELTKARQAYAKQMLMGVVAAAIAYQAELEHQDGPDEAVLSGRLTTLWSMIASASTARQMAFPALGQHLPKPGKSPPADDDLSITRKAVADVRTAYGKRRITANQWAGSLNRTKVAQ